MKNLALLIEYDGTNYGGWQIQPNAPTIQEEIQSAFFGLTGESVILIGAGRTDSGVHSSGQTANTILSDDFPIPEHKIAIALNTKLPHDIRILQAKFTDENFHSRYDALAREYEYNIHTKDSVFYSRYSTYFKYPFEEETLLNTAHIFIGEQDFTSFSKLNTSTKSYICNVDLCDWKQIAPDRFKLTIRANRFVYGMVRSIAGAMLEVAAGRLFLSDLLFGLNNPNRNNFIKLAPPNGLLLKRIYYPNAIF